MMNFFFNLNFLKIIFIARYLLYNIALVSAIYDEVFAEYVIWRP